jgi:hypothetical protein
MAGSDPEMDDGDDEDEEIEPGKEEMFDANSNIETVSNYECPNYDHPQPMIHSPSPPSPDQHESKSMFVEPQSPPSPESKPLVLDTSVDTEDDEEEENFDDSGIIDPTETSTTDIDSSIDNNQSLNSSGITA